MCVHVCSNHEWTQFRLASYRTKLSDQTRFTSQSDTKLGLNMAGIQCISWIPLLSFHYLEIKATEVKFIRWKQTLVTFISGSKQNWGNPKKHTVYCIPYVQQHTSRYWLTRIELVCIGYFLLKIYLFTFPSFCWNRKFCHPKQRSLSLSGMLLIEKVHLSKVQNPELTLRK